MRLWLISFLLLFGTAELFQWVQQVSLPLPIFVLGGAFLAIASNYDKLSNLPFHLDYQEPEIDPKEVSSAASPPIPSASASSSPFARKQSPRPVSFDIQKPFKPGD